MYFINPYFLFVSLLIIIPILIHLFNFRRYRKIFFSNVEFLKEIKLQTQKTSQLKHLLVLITRSLAIISLVFAFAEPYIPVADKHKIIQKNNLVSIYIDNSFSMDALNGNGRLLDEAKNKALEIASVYKQSDLFQILTNDFEGKHQRLVTIEEFKQMLSEVKTSPVSRTLSEIVKRQTDLLKSNNSAGKNAYIISDFQQNICDINQLPKDSLIKFFLIPVSPNEISNLYIDSIWFDSPVKILNQKVRLHVKIINISKNDLDKVPVKLTINNKQRAVSSFKINANASAEIILPFTIIDKGINYGAVEITDYPITFDNTFYFSFNVVSKISILSISQGLETTAQNTDYINSLFGKDSLFNLTNSSANSIDYSSFKNYPLIICNGLNNISSGLSQEFVNYLKNRGNLAVFPGGNIDIESYQAFLKSANSAFYVSKDTAKTKISEINLSNSLYHDVFEKMPENIDFPEVFKHYVINIFTRSSAETLIKLQNGDDFLAVQPSGKGNIYLFAVPLDIRYSNFPRHSLFVPTLYRIALLSQNNENLYNIIGKDDIVPLRSVAANSSDENIIKVKKINSDFEIVPQLNTNNDQLTTIDFHNQVKEAGNYIAYTGNYESISANNDNLIQAISFNYNRKESDLKYFDATQIQDMLNKANLKNYSVINVKNKPLTKVIAELNLGIKLWKWFIILALIFLALEVVLLRFFKQ